MTVGIFAVFCILGLVCTWAWAHLDALRVLLIGKHSFDEELPQIAVSIVNRVVFAGAILGLCLCAYYLATTMHVIQTTANDQRTQAAEIKQERLAKQRAKEDAQRNFEVQKLNSWISSSGRVLDKSSSKLDAGIRNALSNAHEQIESLSKELEANKNKIIARNAIEEVSARLTAIEQKISSSGDVIISGTRERDVQTFADEVVEQSVWDGKTGTQKALIVVHLFRDKGYWKFRSPNTIVDNDESDGVYFWSLFDDSSVKSELSDFDLVVGIGLSSKSPRVDEELSRFRAAYLCSGIKGAVRNIPDLDVLGLDIGSYQGSRSESESESSQNRNLRPVIVAAIKVHDSEASYPTFHEELLREVEVGGLDLGLFSKLANKQPKWISLEECAKEFRFAINKDP